jgi:pimeloyl-ACP methyl ester carboxylesterase
MPHNTAEIALHVERSGNGPQTLLLIHGFADNSATWHKVVPTLGAHFRVLAVDLPGFGRASRAMSDPLIPGYVELLRELLRAEANGPVMVIGNSLGAVTALALATAHPELVDRVVLADMPGIDRLPKAWGVVMSRPTELLLRTAAFPIPSPLLRHGIGLAYAAGAMRHPLQPGFAVMRTGFDRYYAEKANVLSLLPTGRRVLASIAALPIRRMIREATVPVLLLWGQHDVLTPSRKARSFVDGPARRVVVIPDCGHCPQLDRPDDFLAAVMPFVAQEIRRAG